MEVTKFDALEETAAEMKLKQLLWSCIDEWDAMIHEWTAASFESLDVEHLTAQTMKYAKAVNQLEKGLPPNGLVPQLKERVESLREKVTYHCLYTVVSLSLIDLKCKEC